MNLITMVNQYSELIKKSTDCSGSIEATFESLTIEKIKTISECSPLIKRISFGLQNVNSSFLKNNNRSNGPFKTMALLFNECRRRNIPVLNIDLMYGFMNQSEADMRATMTVVKELAPEHLTVYELRTNMLHNYQTASQKQRYRQYSYLYGLITDLGYKGRYGQNTFSKIDDFGVSPYLYHRMVENGSYKGFGISAQSKSIKGLSYNIGKNGESLIECCKRGTFENGDTYLLPPREMLSKYLAICGYCGFFDLNIMENIIHSDPMIEFNSVFEFLINNDLVSIDDRKVFISNKGFMNYGAILSLFFDNLSNIPLE
jgi:oxygen-independent coproporphyrinogen-3 oxidase